MNADRLLALYEKVADAPDAVAKLRKLILDLAVRGKLVEQDPADEPASELLKRIASEKARLVERGEIRKPKAILPLALDDLSFTVPRRWVWTQIAELGIINPRNQADDNFAASFVPMPLIAVEYGLGHGHERRPWGEIKKGYTHFAEGDVGLAKITPCFENGKSTVFRNLTGGIGAGTTELHVVRPLFVDADYIVLFLKSPYYIKTGIPRMTGTAGQKRVPTEYFTSAPFPLPPLAEQHRIVAKVDELMGLCDRLEAARGEREAVRDRLAAASLARLNAPDPDPATFRRHATFTLDNLTPLTTRPDQIRSLRQTILNLAVRGKLVEQDPADEPASELLKRVQCSRTNNRKLAELNQVDIESELPVLPIGWFWTVVDQISADDVRAITDGPFGSQLKTAHYIEESGYRVIRLQNVAAGYFREEHHSYVDEHRYECLVNHHVKPGDLIVAGLVDPNVRCCEVPASIGPALVKADCYRFAVHHDFDRRFALRYLNSPFAQEFASVHHHGMTLTRIGLGNFRKLPFPLPPLAEQHRIVAKVDALMALCDRLEASLLATDGHRARLLDALLAEALAPALARKDVAA